ncbi:hypothetical protein AgCh_020520 [Apium graveolens]
METILIDCVNNSLRHFLYHNAIFMCERLCAEFPTETNSQLLAACYLQGNQAHSAYHILKGTQQAQSRYLFAISCFQMNLLSEAETALSPAGEPSAEVPNGAAGHYLLGLIYRYTDRRRNAVHHFNQALSIDPLFWAAYEELCILGAAKEGTAVFGEAASLYVQKQYSAHGLASQNMLACTENKNPVPSKSLSLHDPSPRQVKNMHGNNTLKDNSANYHGTTLSGGTSSQFVNGGFANTSFYNTPSPMAAQISAVAPPPICRNMQGNGPNPSLLGAEGSPRSTINSTMPAPRRKFVDEGKLRKISGKLFDSGPRRSTRLSGESGPSTGSNATLFTGNGTSHAKHLAGSKLSSVSFRSVTFRKGQARASETFDEGVQHESYDDLHQSMTTTSTPSLACDNKSHEEGILLASGGTILSESRAIAGARELVMLLAILGEGYRLSCMYHCQDALAVYLKLPNKHYNTGWVLSQVGKAHFELVDYLEADFAFNQARLISPYSFEEMDIYSTVLFHLKEDMKLSYLSQELVSTDRLAPQSWVAMGNCYSLQKDHETAIKNFQRAVQLNPRFAYAHTLCGHEFVALEDFDNGIKSYQSALQIDERHYNAWYGLGMIYLRQEKFEFAEHHFRKAFDINSRSSVIMTYLGTALHTLKRSVEGLVMMENAISADKKNPLPMYQKANILASMGNFHEALDVLEELKEYAPRESSVYALMGRLYKICNMPGKAMHHFGLALDLKPSATDVATIKAAIEKLHVPDGLDYSL